jgi:UDP-N-acetylmuramoyl-tripeptide--D-alanyl-D-alanine ligase
MLSSDTNKISSVINCKLNSNKAVKFQGVCTDTRDRVSGKLFIALEGVNFDGHNFIKQAEDLGAVAVIAHKRVDSNLPTLLVSNSEEAYQKLAAWHRQSFSPIVIAITGSNGKTSTKNMLHSILSLHGPTLSTKGNLNNHLGVPKTLLELAKKHQYCIIEMGANHVNEIELLCKLAQPDIAIITNANNAHLGEFGSEKNLVKAKGEILESLSGDGIAIINKSSPHIDIWEKMSGTQNLTFFGNKSNVYASNIKQFKSTLNFSLNFNHSSINITLSMIGLHQIENVLAAAACAIKIGISPDLIKKGLEKVRSEKGRLELIELQNFTILDDSYNANPQSVKAAIDSLKQFSGKKVLVLGTMAELGKDSSKLHQEIGDYAREQNIDSLITIGQEAQCFKGSHFDDIESIFNEINNYHKGATVLIKGSRKMELNKLVDILINTSNSS